MLMQVFLVNYMDILVSLPPKMESSFLFPPVSLMNTSSFVYTVRFKPATEGFITGG